jgi:hypothetical protein
VTAFHASRCEYPGCFFPQLIGTLHFQSTLDRENVGVLRSLRSLVIVLFLLLFFHASSRNDACPISVYLFIIGGRSTFRSSSHCCDHSLAISHVMETNWSSDFPFPLLARLDPPLPVASRLPSGLTNSVFRVAGCLRTREIRLGVAVILVSSPTASTANTSAMPQVLEEGLSRRVSSLPGLGRRRRSRTLSTRSTNSQCILPPERS